VNVSLVWMSEREVTPRNAGEQCPLRLSPRPENRGLSPSGSIAPLPMPPKSPLLRIYPQVGPVSRPARWLKR
jgi:hypothetical protein